MKGGGTARGDILQGLIPTPQMLTGDFSGTGKTIKDPFNSNHPFPGNIIPAEPVGSDRETICCSTFQCPIFRGPARISSQRPATSSGAIRAPCESIITSTKSNPVRPLQLCQR